MGTGYVGFGTGGVGEMRLRLNDVGEIREIRAAKYWGILEEGERWRGKVGEQSGKGG